MGSEQLTVIVVSEETAPVRRFRVRRGVVTRSIWIAGTVALLLSAGLVDYVRLRINAVDVQRLREESSARQKAVESLNAEVVDLQKEFGTVRELERKIRIMANLPGAMPEARTPEDLEAGRGGPDADVPGARAAQGATTDSNEAPHAHRFPPVSASPELALDPVALARTQTKAWRLAEIAPNETASLQELLEGLHGKSQRLASTPSIWPTDGWVTSGWGYRTNPFTGGRQFHTGVDIATKFGTTIVAPARGRVAFVGRHGALGKAVIIDHGYGIRTTYGHTSEIFVTAGQRVERGTPIAAVGSTGRSTGPHVHYSVTVNKKSVNPMNYILD